jgi:hypothetical protein
VTPREESPIRSSRSGPPVPYPYPRRGQVRAREGATDEDDDGRHHAAVQRTADPGPRGPYELIAACQRRPKFDAMKERGLRSSWVPGDARVAHVPATKEAPCERRL